MSHVPSLLRAHKSKVPGREDLSARTRRFSGDDRDRYRKKKLTHDDNRDGAVPNQGLFRKTNTDVHDKDDHKDIREVTKDIAQVVVRSFLML